MIYESFNLGLKNKVTPQFYVSSTPQTCGEHNILHANHTKMCSIARR